MKSDIWLEVCRLGVDAEAVGLTPALMLQMVKNYDPSITKAPITLDHNQYGPAFGSVDKLRMGDANGQAQNSLYAHFDDVDPELRELVLNGNYTKRSIEFYPTYRDTEQPYFAAVSFLGAMSPQVRGLEDPKQAFLSEKDKRVILTTGIEPEQTIKQSEKAVSLDSSHINNREVEPMTDNGQQNLPGINVEKENADLKRQLAELNSKLAENDSKEALRIKLETDKKILEEQDKQAKLSEIEKERIELRAMNVKIEQHLKNAKINEEITALRESGLLNPAFITNGGKEFLQMLPNDKIIEWQTGEVKNQLGMRDYAIKFMATLDKPIKTQAEVTIDPNRTNPNYAQFNTMLSEKDELYTVSADVVLRVEAYAKDNKLSFNEAYAEINRLGVK